MNIEDLRRLIREEIYSIGAGGLQRLKNIFVAPNSIYYMGASSSPDQILVISVDNNKIVYMKPYVGQRSQISLEIGKDLIAKGTQTFVKGPAARYHSKLATSLKNNLKGKKGSENGKAKAIDFQKYIVTLQGTTQTKDLYGQAKSYGIVGKWNSQDGENGEIEVQVYKRDVPTIRRDRAFNVLKTRKGKLI